MGTGAYMYVQNDSELSVRCTVSDVECMQQNGESGSHLERFNGVVINPKSRLPTSGGIYIEDKNSGGCFFIRYGKFTLDFDNIGKVAIAMDAGYSCVTKNTNQDVINAKIDNSGSQDQIAITLIYSA